jgi:hypothetical protein
MTAEFFVDTNILLYSIDEDPASQMKRQRSQELLLTENWGWSVQVAAEFFVNATSPNVRFDWQALTRPRCLRLGSHTRRCRLRRNWCARLLRCTTAIN